MFSSTDEGQQHYYQSQSSQSFNVLQTMIPSFPLKGYAPQNNDPLVLVPLSMLQLGRLKSVTSPQTILQSPTRISSTSETENEARKFFSFTRKKRNFIVLKSQFTLLHIKWL